MFSIPNVNYAGLQTIDFPAGSGPRGLLTRAGESKSAPSPDIATGSVTEERQLTGNLAILVVAMLKQAQTPDLETRPDKPVLDLRA